MLAKLKLLWRVLVCAAKNAWADRVKEWAAAIAFYVILCAVPVCLVTVSLAGYVVSPEDAIQRLSPLFGVLNESGRRFIENLLREALGKSGSLNLLSWAVIVFSGSRVFSILSVALNLTFDAKERPAWRRIAMQLLMMSTVGVMFLLAFIGAPIVAATTWFLGREDLSGPVMAALQFVLPPLLLFSALVITYRFVPSRGTDWLSALSGAALALILIHTIRPLFFVYIEKFTSYSSIYGPLTAAVVLVLWVWIVATAVLLGGEYSAQFYYMCRQGESEEEVSKRRQGKRELLNLPSQEVEQKLRLAK